MAGEEVSRRSFLKHAGIVGGAAALSGCAPQQGPAAGGGASGKHYEWQMVTAWPANFPVLQESAEEIAAWIAAMSSGRLTIQVHGAGELVPALGVFDAVAQGSAQMGHSAAYYWKGKSAAAQFFTTVPFGFNAQQMNAWLLAGGGMELWRELYADFGLVPFAIGNTGVQMGGWFRNEIGSLSDLKGLKMRIPGLGGEVLSAAGGKAELTPGGEIYTSLERGRIDATEFIGPFHDTKLGLHKVADYYYYPGWHEPGSTLEMMVNKAAYDELPADLQAIVTAAAARSNMLLLSRMDAANSTALVELRAAGKTKILPFPEDVLSGLRKHATEVLDGMAGDPFTKRVYESYRAFRENISVWSKVSEQAYYDL